MSTTEQGTDDRSEGDTAASLQAQLDELAAELDAERARRQDLEGELQALREHHTELQAQLETVHEQRAECEALLDALQRRLGNISEALFGEGGSPTAYEALLAEHPPLVEWLDQLDPDAIAELDAELHAEAERLAAEDAKLRREVHTLADAVDVDLTAADIQGDDKLVRVLRNGPEAVESTVNPVDRRAAALLCNIDRWGQLTTDAYGKRFVVPAPVAKDRLEDVRDESLASVQIKRVFEKLETWGHDSPRVVRVDHSGTENRLLIQLEVTE